jgi:hypothetical protein
MKQKKFLLLIAAMALSCFLLASDDTEDGEYNPNNVLCVGQHENHCRQGGSGCAFTLPSTNLPCELKSFSKRD